MIYDISPTLSERLAVWPGDTPLRREILLDRERGDNITLSTIHTTVHLGAHADGPNHYGTGVPGIDAAPLEVYLGPCHLIRVPAQPRQRISERFFPGPIRAERVLIATGTYPNPEHFLNDFAALDPTLIEYLHRQGVRLVGIDTPSVDLFDSAELPTHQACLKHSVAILEGLVLENVPEGVYELIALPLKLRGFDASPVRAVLRT